MNKILSIKMTFFFLVFMMILGCDKEPNPNPTTSESEVLFFNGKIYTVDQNQPWAEAVYVINGVIKQVGTNDEVMEHASEKTEFIDLEGKFMMPGIHDVHLHPLEAASNNFHFILEDNIQDPEDYAKDIVNAANQNPDASWLLGWGHWIDVPLSATRPPKEIIDDVVSNRPVAIMEQTSHSIWCNSKALELMGIDDDTDDPIGGVIMREIDGEASGILVDNAGNLLLDIALSSTPERMQNDYNGLIEYALPELSKNGITSIADARTYWKRDHHKVWQRIAEESNLTVRTVLGLWAYPSEEDALQIETLKSLFTDDPQSLLRINQIKLYCDGIIHNTTSAMHDDFLVDYFGLATNNGLNYFSEQRIAHYISELEEVGFDFHIHAIGNRGVHEALNAIEQSGTEMGRHRLTHVEYVNTSDLNRFAQLNVTADAQVAGDFSQPEHWHDNDYLIGSELNKNVIPLKSLKDGGARISLSSDWDVSSLNPFEGIQNAVTRIPQNLILEESIKAYTINAAYVMRQEEIVGSIQEGKQADLIILDRNIFEIPEIEISQTLVLETYLNGKLIFQR